MQDDESDVYTYYCELDENGEPDFYKPIPVTKEQFVKDYLYNVDDQPDTLADLYIDFYDFDRVEFLVFKGNLSAAILVSRSAHKAMAELKTRLKGDLEKISQTAKWAEETMPLEEAIYTTEDAYKIAIGATILTAVAALESLVLDLSPSSARRLRGLQERMQAFLERHTTTAVQAAQILESTKKVAKRRNTFAHTLTGSYFDKSKAAAAMFTPETMEETLYAVGNIAATMHQIMDATESHQP